MLVSHSFNANFDVFFFFPRWLCSFGYVCPSPHFSQHRRGSEGKPKRLSLAAAQAVKNLEKTQWKLRLFPTVSPWTPLDLQKKNCVARKRLFKKHVGWTSFGLIMFPTVSDRFRPFPTVSDRFHFSERLYNWTNSVYGRLFQCKPMQTMTLKFFRATLVRVHCTKYCILTLISHIP